MNRIDVRLDDDPDKFGEELIKRIKDPEVRWAVKVLWAKKGVAHVDRNSVGWGLPGDDETDACFTLGITQW